MLCFFQPGDNVAHAITAFAQTETTFQFDSEVFGFESRLAKNRGEDKGIG